MKQPKKLTLEQKKAVSAYHLNPKNYLWIIQLSMFVYEKIITENVDYGNC